MAASTTVGWAEHVSADLADPDCAEQQGNDALQRLQHGRDCSAEADRLNARAGRLLSAAVPLECV